MTPAAAREGTQALIQGALFRSQRLSSLRLAALCSFPLWVHAYLHAVPGAVLWLAVLGYGAFVVLAGLYGALERTCRRRSSDRAGAVAVVALGWPALDPLRSGLLTLAAVLTAGPWLAGLGVRMPSTVQAADGALATVVIGPALALELLDAARVLTRATRTSHGGA